MDNITVKVEQHHIDNGSKADAHKCPIALALGEQLGWPNPTVNLNEVYGGINSSEYPSYRPSERAARFVRDFDSNKPVSPATFRFARFKH